LITLLPAIYTGTNEALDLIWQSGLAESSKRLYIGIIAKYLETGEQLTDTRALARFAGDLTNSRKPIFRAAVGCWSRELVAELEATVTPETLPQVQASIMRLTTLTRSIKVKAHRGKRAHTWLSDDQIAQLYESCADDLRGLRDKVVLGLMVTCGLRRGEVVALQWRHIIAQPFEGELCAVLNVINGKGNRNRAIPLPPALLGLLDEWAEHIGRRGYVVRSMRGPHIKPRASRAVPSYVVKIHGAAIDLPNLAPHDLRRSAAQAWWNASHDLLLVSELLGHKSVETTRVYLLVDQARKIEVVQAVRWGDVGA
jgi:integrase